MLRTPTLLLLSLTLLGCAEARSMAEVEKELVPLRQDYERCVVRVAEHYAKEEIGLKQVITAGETLCGKQRQGIRDVLFESLLDPRQSQHYLDQLDDDIAVAVALAMRQKRQAAGSVQTQ